MASADKIKTTIEVDSKDEKKIDSAGKKFKKLEKEILGVSASVLKTVGIYTTAGVAVKALTDKAIVFGKESIQAASDAQETANKFNVVYSSIIDRASEAADELHNFYGLSSRASQQLLSDTGDLFAGLGATQGEALELSEIAAKLGVDLASFTNYAGGAEGAVDALRKAMLGETEAAKGLGLVLNETQLKKYAKDHGLIVEELSLTEKAQVRMRMAVEQSKNAMGDFQRSIDSYANTARLGESATEDLKQEIGEGLLPVLSKAQKLWADVAGTMARNLNATNTIAEVNKKLKEGTATYEDQVRLAEAQLWIFNEFFKKTGKGYEDLSTYEKKQYDTNRLLLQGAKERLELQRQLTIESENQARVDEYLDSKRKEAEEENRRHLDALNDAYAKTKQAQEEAIRQQIAYFETFVQGPKAIAVLQMLRDELERISSVGKKENTNVKLTIYDKALQDEAQRVRELNETWEAYYQIKREIAILEQNGFASQEYQIQLQLLYGVEGSLEETLNITRKIGDETKNNSEKIKDFAEVFKEQIANINSVSVNLANSFTAIGSGLAQGLSMSAAASEALRQQFASITSQISSMAIAAGLRTIIDGGLAALPVAIGLFAIGGITGIAAGLASSRTGAYGLSESSQKIIDAEKELADERINIIREQLEEERTLRNENIRKLQQTFDLEFEILRDAWQRNLISTSAFQEQSRELNTGLNTGIKEEEDAKAEAEASAAAEEERIRALEDARAKKIKELDAALQRAEAEWRKVKAQNLFVWPWVRDEHEDRISKLRRRIETAKNATTVEQVLAAKYGANFVTNGPQLMMVGDNPGGREHVVVEPMPAPINRSTQSEVIIHVSGPIYGIDHFTQLISATQNKLMRRGRGNVA